MFGNYPDCEKFDRRIARSKSETSARKIVRSCQRRLKHIVLIRKLL